MLASDLRPPISYHLVRIALGFVYFHFGFLKLFPDLSPAEMLATQTIIRLTGGMLDASDALFFLAILEVTLGLALLFNVFMRLAFGLFLLHMAGTFSPIILLPELAFKVFPFAPTIEGQYILKNIVFVAAGWGILAPHLFLKKANRNPTESPATAPPTTARPRDIATPSNPTDQLKPVLVPTDAPQRRC